jgi:hypothetical protein
MFRSLEKIKVIGVDISSYRLRVDAFKRIVCLIILENFQGTKASIKGNQ